MKHRTLPYLLLSSLLLAACSGNNGSSKGGANSAELPTAVEGALSGTAAIGAPLSKAQVTVYGNGCSKENTTNINGVFTVNMGTCEGPYLVKVEGSLGTVYSLATNEDVGTLVNASPLTSLVTSLVLGSSDLSSANGTSVSSVTSSVISDKANIVKVIMEPLLTEFKVGSDDIMKGSFKANGQGLDRVLDAISIAPAGGNVQLNLKGGTPIAIPTNIDETAAATAASNVSSVVTAISSTMNDLDALQTDITAAVTSIIKRSSNISEYCHSSYLESGYRECFDYYDSSSGSVRVSRPIILEKLDEKTYWVAFDLFLKEAGDADFQLEFAGNIIQMKKNETSGKWQFYGNQLEYDTEFTPAVMAIQAGSSNMGYYFQMHEAVGGQSVAYAGKNVSITFQAESMANGTSLTISGTLDEFGQLNSPSNPSCLGYNPDFSWHCLKGFTVPGNPFKGQFAKIVASYPNPEDVNSSLTKTFYVQTPKGMSAEVPDVTVAGTNGSVTECKVEISSATWAEPTGKLRLDYLDPIWYQSNKNYDLGEDDDRIDQSGDRGETQKTFSPVLKAFDNGFNPDAEFSLGLQATFNDVFERRYIRFSTCK